MLVQTMRWDDSLETFDLFTVEGLARYAGKHLAEKVESFTPLSGGVIRLVEPPARVVCCTLNHKSRNALRRVLGKSEMSGEASDNHSTDTE